MEGGLSVGESCARDSFFCRRECFCFGVLVARDFGVKEVDIFTRITV